MGESYHYFVPPKEMKLQQTTLQMKWLTPGVLEITASDYLAKDVYLTLLAGQFSDNYFDLLPGSSRTIQVNYAPKAVMELWMKEHVYPNVKMLEE